MSMMKKYHIWTSIEAGIFFPVFSNGYHLENGFFFFDDETSVSAQIVERIELVATGYEYGDIAKEMNDEAWRNRGQTEVA